MPKTCVALSLTLLLSISPALSAFVPLICCCDDGVSGVHLYHEDHASSGHYHGDDHAHPQASHHFDDDLDNHQQSRGNYASDSDQAFDADVVVASGSVGLLPPSCTCGEADDPSGATAQVGMTNRTTFKLASGGLDSAIKVAFERPHPTEIGVHDTRRSPPRTQVFLVNRSLLI